ncbi:MAG: TMEM165/GDT1 family protein, partial [Methanothrix sp.]|nr:TMEM165/GDT1 family protein [Methanothrix sp.]
GLGDVYKRQVSGFSVIFLSEWGDKTQIASALFAAEYGPRMVFFGVMSALLILSVAAVYLGRLLAERIERKVITKAAGTVFLLIGLSLLISAIPAFDV